MTDDVKAVWTLLRAVVDARRTHFHRLWVDASYAVPGSAPTIGYSVVDRVDQGVNLNAGLTVRRPDGVMVGWSVSVQALPEVLVVVAMVEVEDGHGTAEPFTRSENAPNVETAVSLADTLAAEVCRQRSWLSTNPPNGL